MTTTAGAIVKTDRAAIEPRLRELAELALDEARRVGASQAEVGVSESAGLSINVRRGEVETVEHNRDKSLSVSAYHGYAMGTASSSDFSRAAVIDTVRAAYAIARHTAEDPAIGLADADRMAREFPDLDVDHPWVTTTDELIDLATRCEASAYAHDERIVNSDGATVATEAGLSVIANSHGFCGVSGGTRHSVVCSVVGQSGDAMQTGYWYTSGRDPLELESAEDIGRKASERTVGKLNAEQIATTRTKVLYEAPIASSLLGHFIGAINGGAQYRKSSFLLGMAGERVFPEFVRIHEQPHLPKGAGSSAFDSEGVATVAQDIVTNGVINQYVMSSYSARKLGLATTGNAGGVRNLTIESGSLDREALLREMGDGLLVTDLIGSGINGVTGDYSRGASGFWVENGEIVKPVEGITIASNLKDMFANIVAVGTDVDMRGNTQTGSILIDAMTVAGS